MSDCSLYVFLKKVKKDKKEELCSEKINVNMYGKILIIDKRTVIEKKFGR